MSILVMHMDSKTLQLINVKQSYVIAYNIIYLDVADDGNIGILFWTNYTFQDHMLTKAIQLVLYFWCQREGIMAITS